MGTTGIQAADQIIQTTALTVTETTEVDADLRPLHLRQKPFVSLMKGTGLEGWQVQEGKVSAWKREGDVVSCLASTGGWLRTDAKYSDFVVRLEYRMQKGGNTGIGIRAPGVGNPTFKGMEIQLLDDSAEKYQNLRPDQYTGSVYYQVPAVQKAPLKPLDEWNMCEIRCLGDELTVRVNGVVVNQVNLNQKKKKDASEAQSRFLLSQRPPLGHLALQSHSSRVDFRRIEVVDLTTETASGLKYTDLEVGTGEELTDATSVMLHYVGQLTDGKRFTDTRDLEAPVSVPLEGVIPGLEEGIRSMRVGGKRRLIVPPDLAYGSQGVANLIPPDSTLVFEIEICSLEQPTE